MCVNRPIHKISHFFSEIAMILSLLWADDAGAILSTEYLLLATVLVGGTVGGLSTVCDAVNAEWHELAGSYKELSQGYTIKGQSGCGGSSDGSQAIDLPGN